MSSIKKYEYVIEIARCGGISQAAESLGIAQPTLSKYIKKLEEELGAELFDRSSFPIKPTEAGVFFIEAGKKAIDLERQLKKQIGEVKNGKSSLVRIGISPSRSPYMLPAIIAAYKAKNPGARIQIEEKTTAELSEKLSCGDLDLVINLLDDNTAGFERIDLFEEDILLAVAKSELTDERDAIAVLNNHPLITVGKGQAMWQTTHRITGELNIPAPEIECRSIESALALVRRGLGAMIVPDYISKFSSKNDSELHFFSLSSLAKSISSALYKRKVCIFYRKEQFLTKAERDFISCVKAVL